MTEDTSTLPQRLCYLLDTFNLTQADLGRATQIPRTTINGIASGKILDPRVSTLQAIATFFGLTIEQLLGRSPVFTNDQQPLQQRVLPAIPILDWEAVAHHKEKRKTLTPQTHTHWLPVDPECCGLWATQPPDDPAMWPQFQTGTVLLIDPQRSPKDRDLVLVQIAKTGAVLFRQLQGALAGAGPLLKPLNPSYPVLPLTAADRILGVVAQTRHEHG